MHAYMLTIVSEMAQISYLIIPHRRLAGRDNRGREGEKRSSDDVRKKCNGIIKVIQFPF